MRWVAIMCTVWVLGACGSSEPETMEDCLKMEAGTKRDACLQEKIVEAFREDPERAEQIIAEQDNSEGLRDFMWYLITREVDPNSNRFCEKIESQALGERCRDRVASTANDPRTEARTRGSSARAGRSCPLRPSLSEGRSR